MATGLMARQPRLDITSANDVGAVDVKGPLELAKPCSSAGDGAGDSCYLAILRPRGQAEKRHAILLILIPLALSLNLASLVLAAVIIITQVPTSKPDGKQMVFAVVVHWILPEKLRAAFNTQTMPGELPLPRRQLFSFVPLPSYHATRKERY